jgi:hypothetical protein
LSLLALLPNRNGGLSTWNAGREKKKGKSQFMQIRKLSAILHKKPPGWLLSEVFLLPAPTKSRDQPDNHKDEPYYERHVGKTTQRNRAEKSQKPQYQEDDSNNQQYDHVFLLPSAIAHFRWIS